VNVEQQIKALIAREGGYSDHPADRGGPTRYGITEQVARAFGYRGDMRLLPITTARDIYFERYWTGPKFDQVAAIYPHVGEELFDTGVNMGQAVAARFLQRALNLLNRAASDYPDITVDGAIGRMSLASLRSFQAKRGAAGELVLLRALDGQQCSRYMDLAESKESQEAFLYGWIANRVGEPA
jgi:lysozyme family protein